MRELQILYVFCCLVVVSQCKSVNPRYLKNNMGTMNDFVDDMNNLMYKDPVMYKIQNKFKRAVLDHELEQRPDRLHNKISTDSEYPFPDSADSQRKTKVIINANKMGPFELHREYKINPKLLNVFTTKFALSDPLMIKVRKNDINVTSISKLNDFEPSGGYKISVYLKNRQETAILEKTDQSDFKELISDFEDNTSESHECSYENSSEKKLTEEIIYVPNVETVTENISLGGEKGHILNVGNDDSAEIDHENYDSVEQTIPFDETFNENANNSLTDKEFDYENDDSTEENSLDENFADGSLIDKEEFDLENDDSVEEIIPFDGTFDENFADDSLIDKEFEKDNGLNLPFEGSGDDESFKAESVSSQSKNSVDKDGRILGVFSRVNSTTTVCTTPKGESGRCLRITQCLLSDALSNFNDFLQYLCLVRGARIGVCCPDNPVIEIQHPDNEISVEIAENDIKQPPEGCGLNRKTRIVGGTTSVPHEWTWMVALLRRNRFFCGGVIINNWYVLTAAHCVRGVNVRDLKVRLGEYNFNEKTEHQEDLAVAEIKRHAKFISLTFQHDIALLKLKRKVQYTKFIGSICLPSDSHVDYSNVNATVVGWGTVSFGGAASPVLRQVTIPVWKNEDCDRTYALENINDNFMCAGSPKDEEDACQGDSGGPLMALNKAGRWEVIGIVSWGRRCGDPTYPGVYTRVTKYLDWIKENAK